MQLSGLMNERRLLFGLVGLVITLLVLSATAFYSDLPALGQVVTSAIHSTSSEDQIQVPDHPIPDKIWQISLDKKDTEKYHLIDPLTLQDAPSWLALNTGYEFTLVGEDWADEFLQRYYADDTQLLEAYDSIWNVGMRSDLLRYLILEKEGGVYTDTDTIALKGVDNWLSPELRDQVHVIVGIEYDRRNDKNGWGNIPHNVSLCQWTIAAAPGHNVFREMTARILRDISTLEETYGLPFSEIHPTDFEVLNSTGPAAWTDVVFKELQKNDSSLRGTKDLSFMTEPTLFGDILILPIDGFGMGQQHSNSTHDGSIPEAALVKHNFRGSWRGEKH